ncbi:unnamed protein product, partial [marine sediment metagenome]
ADLSQRQLEEMVEGKPQNPNVMFYEQATLDHVASKEAGHRVYRKAVFIKVTQPGVTDWTAYKAQPQDLRSYPEEYEFFLNNKQGDQVPGVEIIPNLDIAHLQELRDMGLTTIPRLADSKIVPPHLEYARHSAIAINAVLQEQSNGEEESNQESEETDNLPQADRPVNPVSISRPGVQASPSIADDKAAEGLQEGGRIDHSQGRLIDSFQYDFQIRR